MVKPIIILSGSDVGNGNLGDEWLTDAAKNFYRPYARDFRIIMLRHRFPPQNGTEPFYYAHRSAEALAAFDFKASNIALVHFTGGGYLNTFWYKDNIWLFDWLRQLGLPAQRIVFTGQGVGPLTSSQRQDLARIVRSVSLFTTRDKLSQKNVPAATFGFDESIGLVSLDRPPRRQSKLGVNIRLEQDHAKISHPDMVRALQLIDNFLQNQQLSANFFSMIKNPEYDELPLQLKLATEAGITPYQTVKRAESYQGLMRSIDNCQCVVTTSYHASLASLYRGIPVVSLYGNDYYEAKFIGLKSVLPSPLLHVRQIKAFSKATLMRAISLATPKNIATSDRLIKGLARQNAGVWQTIATMLDTYLKGQVSDV